MICDDNNIVQITHVRTYRHDGGTSTRAFSVPRGNICGRHIRIMAAAATDTTGPRTRSRVWKSAKLDFEFCGPVDHARPKRWFTPRGGTGWRTRVDARGARSERGRQSARPMFSRPTYIVSSS